MAKVNRSKQRTDLSSNDGYDHVIKERRFWKDYVIDHVMRKRKKRKRKRILGNDHVTHLYNILFSRFARIEDDRVNGSIDELDPLSYSLWIGVVEIG